MNLQVIVVSLGLLALQVLATQKEPNLSASENTTIVPTTCDVNLCFAIQGSNTLTRSQFRLQRNIVINLMRNISSIDNVTAAAVQYGLSNNVISPSTDNVTTFNGRIFESGFENATGSFISGGIIYCHAELARTSGRPSKLVLLGNGVADIGTDPAQIAERFRDDIGEILVVGIGDDADMDSLTKIAGGSANVFSIRNWTGRGSLIRRIVRSLCSIEL